MGKGDGTTACKSQSPVSLAPQGDEGFEEDLPLEQGEDEAHAVEELCEILIYEDADLFEDAGLCENAAQHDDDK